LGVGVRVRVRIRVRVRGMLWAEGREQRRGEEE
jgi:hypothetical protein